MRLKKRQDRLAAQGEATLEEKIVPSNRTKHDMMLKAVEMSVVSAKPIHLKDHVKVVHIQDSQIGEKTTAQNLNYNL